MHFSREYSYISHHFLCISLSQKSKFPSRLSNFPWISLPDYPFFPTMPIIFCPHTDQVQKWYILWPDPGPTWLYSLWTGPDQNILSTSTKINQLKTTTNLRMSWNTCNIQLSSGIIITVLTQFGNARHGFHLIPSLSQKFLERNIWFP